MSATDAGTINLLLVMYLRLPRREAESGHAIEGRLEEVEAEGWLLIGADLLPTPGPHGHPVVYLFERPDCTLSDV